MVKSKIALLVIAIILYSCQNKVLINELEIVDGKTLYNGKNYSGIAIQKDNQDNIRVEEKYNDGIKFDCGSKEGYVKAIAHLASDILS